MNELLDDDDVPLSRKERELTLSTGAILSIFFALVLLCGACFGVGYNVGRKSVPAPLTLADNGLDTPSTDSAAAKPAPGSPMDATPASTPTVVSQPAPKHAPVVRKAPAEIATEEASTPSTAAPARTAAPAPAPIVRAVPPAALLPGAGSSASATESFTVQVAAVSHKEDADLLVGALRARGYTVTARPSAVDNFIHVQVGPFADKKDAEAMRQRLLSDGYNAMLKY